MNEPRPILKSSTRAAPYEARWVHRGTEPEEPFVSLTDHAEAIAADQLLYAEASFGWLTHVKPLELHNGANVFIR